MLKAMCEEYKDISSSYRETLHKLQYWLSECQLHGTGHEYNDVLAVLKGWLGTLMDKENIYIYEGQDLGAEAVLLKGTQYCTYLYHRSLETVKKT